MPQRKFRVKCEQGTAEGRIFNMVEKHELEEAERLIKEQLTLEVLKSAGKIVIVLMGGDGALMNTL